MAKKEIHVIKYNVDGMYGQQFKGYGVLTKAPEFMTNRRRSTKGSQIRVEMNLKITCDKLTKEKSDTYIDAVFWNDNNVDLKDLKENSLIWFIGALVHPENKSEKCFEIKIFDMKVIGDADEVYAKIKEKEKNKHPKKLQTVGAISKYDDTEDLPF